MYNNEEYTQNITVQKVQWETVNKKKHGNVKTVKTHKS